MAALTPGKNARCTQPVSMPTTARRSPRGRRPARAAAAAGRAAGASASIARQRRRDPLEQPAARTSRCSPVRWYARSGPRSSRSRRGYGNSAKIAAAQRPVAAGRAVRRSTWARVASMSLSYCTPDGQAVTQAMQPRQASKCSTIESRQRLAVAAPGSSGGSGRAASPSPRPTARRSGRSAGRSRSARSRATSSGPAAGGRRRPASPAGPARPCWTPGRRRCRGWRRPSVRSLPRSGRARAGASGSNWSLTRRIRSSPGTGPHTVDVGLAPPAARAARRRCPAGAARRRAAPLTQRRAAPPRSAPGRPRGARRRPAAAADRAGACRPRRRRGPAPVEQPGRRRSARVVALTSPPRPRPGRQRAPPVRPVDLGARRRRRAARPPARPAPSTPASVPSTSTAPRPAPPGSGRSSSTAVGTTCACTDRCSRPARLAASGSRTRDVRGRRRAAGAAGTRASVIRPSVPYEPVNSLPRS